MSEPTQTDKDIAEIKTLLNGGAKPPAENTPGQTPNQQQQPPKQQINEGIKQFSQESYEQKMEEMRKMDESINAKLHKLESMTDTNLAQGRDMGGAPPELNERDKQKQELMKTFGGCINGLEDILK